MTGRPKLLIALAGLAIGLALAGCGGSRPATRTAASSAPASGPAATPNSGTVVTCSSLSSIIRVLVADQRNQDRTYQEKWVMGNQGDDLNDALDATDAATTGHTQVDSDAAQFNSDANTYLADNSPYLAPGWQAEYKAVKTDIAALADDCGIPHKGF